MAQVRSIAEGPYQPAADERLLQLANTGEVPLYIGIRNGEYMIAAAAGEPQVVYVLTETQWVRTQQQMQLQPTYKKWVASGLLTLTELDSVPAPTPPPPPEEEPMPETPVPAEPPPVEPPTEPPPAEPEPQSELPPEEP